MSGISRAAKAAILVSALGYFVDIYDLLLFGIVRVPSLRTLGVPDSAMKEVGATLLNYQMFGMLLGGIFWGVLGDKKGRLSVLFGSIFLYSVANLANAFVDRTGSVETGLLAYQWLRLIAGIGLAGELGAGITLVSELMPADKRGYGTMIVAGFGILGAVVATLIGDIFPWQTAYIIGGVMGLMLLIMRIGVYESGMYEKTAETDVKRGDFLYLFTSGERFMKYSALDFDWRAPLVCGRHSHYLLKRVRCRARRDLHRQPRLRNRLYVWRIIAWRLSHGLS
jgi:putative MFS transporter